MGAMGVASGEGKVRGELRSKCEAIPGMIGLACLTPPQKRKRKYGACRANENITRVRAQLTPGPSSKPSFPPA